MLPTSASPPFPRPVNFTTYQLLLPASTIDGNPLSSAGTLPLQTGTAQVNKHSILLTSASINLIIMDPLLQSVYEGQYERCVKLLDHGSDPNACTAVAGVSITSQHSRFISLNKYSFWFVNIYGQLGLASLVSETGTPNHRSLSCYPVRHLY